MRKTQIIDALNWRYATEQFKSVPVSEEDISTILEAGRLAPSSMNIQPWKFIRVDDPQIREQLWKAGFRQDKIKDAPHLIILASRTDLDQEDAEQLLDQTQKTRGVTPESLSGYRKMVTGYISEKSPQEAKHWNKSQSYIALGFMLQTAAQLGVDTAPMEGFNTQQVDHILGLTNYTAVTLIALGYRSNKDHRQHWEKVRFPHEDVVETRK